MSDPDNTNDPGIAEATFHIHQDYNPCLVSIKKPPFELTRDGYGIFDVAVDIRMKDGRRVTGKQRDLNFDKAVSWETFRI